jgi:hypothetical protein
MRRVQRETLPHLDRKRVSSRMAKMDTFSEGFKLQQSISDPIASDTWLFKDHKGRKRRTRIEVGRPQQVPGDKNGDWFCPLFIERFTGHVLPEFGVGPIDSLMNAVALLQGFHQQVAWFNISQGTAKGRRATRRSRH